MDHQAFAQMLGSYGEFFGAIAVVVTLIYLAGQLRQNTNALRSGSYAHWNEVSSAWSAFYAQHANELTEMESVRSIAELSPEQAKLYAAFATLTINQAETAFLQHRAGTLDDDVFEARMSSFITFLGQNHLLRQGWLDRGESFNTPAFLRFLDSRAGHLKEGPSI